jgi:hypothetical protein
VFVKDILSEYEIQGHNLKCPVRVNEGDHESPTSLSLNCKVAKQLGESCSSGSTRGLRSCSNARASGLHGSTSSEYKSGYLSHIRQEGAKVTCVRGIFRVREQSQSHNKK